MIPGFRIPWIWDFSFFLSSTFVYEPILLKISKKSSMTSKVNKGHKQWPFYLKIHIFFYLCYWLIEETNAAEHYERTKFDLYKDKICPVLTLTYVLMNNFLSLFFERFTFVFMIKVIPFKKFAYVNCDDNLYIDKRHKKNIKCKYFYVFQGYKLFFNISYFYWKDWRWLIRIKLGCLELIICDYSVFTIYTGG